MMKIFEMFGTFIWLLIALLLLSFLIIGLYRFPKLLFVTKAV